MTKQKRFTREFEDEAVRLIGSSGRTKRQIADTPALSAAASLPIPVVIKVQNSCRSLRVATGGRPGDRNGGRPHRSDRRF